MPLNVLCIFGTRPEAIKMAPVVKALQASDPIDVRVCVTGQHREMLDQVLSLFSVVPDFDLNIMRPNQNLYDVTARILGGMKEILSQARPDLILVHGDTTTCLAAALAGFYEDCPVGHVEAGLRTGNLRAPFPEEANRSLVSRIAQYHFAPTEDAKQNLLREDIDQRGIWVTGNTVIDALYLALRIMPDDCSAYFPEDRMDLYDAVVERRFRRLVLITGHRRENFGTKFRDLCQAIRQLAQAHADWLFVYPVHLNPNVQAPVRASLSDLENVKLVPPLDYFPFVFLMKQCDLILTDSGGLQEEGPALNKPVLVMRDVTERPEALKAGTAKLVGTAREKIVASVEALLTDQALYDTMANATNPYGDGLAAQRILDAILLSHELPGRGQPTTMAV